ncbi:hypothetical protein ABIA00_000287 [Bradyrhizobium ottawaense]
MKSLSDTCRDKATTVSSSPFFYTWGHGENAARPWHRHRLAESKGKDCDRQPHQYDDVQHMNEGRHDGMPTMLCVARELTLMSIMLAEFS